MQVSAENKEPISELQNLLYSDLKTNDKAFIIKRQIN